MTNVSCCTRYVSTLHISSPSLPLSPLLSPPPSSSPLLPLLLFLLLLPPPPSSSPSSPPTENSPANYLEQGEVKPGQQGEGTQIQAEITSTFFVLIGIFFPSVTGEGGGGGKGEEGYCVCASN